MDIEMCKLKKFILVNNVEIYGAIYKKDSLVVDLVTIDSKNVTIGLDKIKDISSCRLNSELRKCVEELAMIRNKMISLNTKLDSAETKLKDTYIKVYWNKG